MTDESPFDTLLARLNEEQREDEAEERDSVRHLLGDEPHDPTEDTADGPTDGNRVPLEGANPSPPRDDAREAVRALFSN